MSDNFSDFEKFQVFTHHNIIIYINDFFNQQKFIFPFVDYNYNETLLMSEYFGKSNLSFFEKLVHHSNNDDLYKITLECLDCGLQWKEIFNYKDFILFISKFNDNIDYLYCSKCKPSSNNPPDISKEEILFEKRLQLIIEQQERNKDIFIKKYLNPDFKWKKGINDYEKIQILKNYCLDPEVIDYIKNLPYKDFLLTPYWKTIKKYKEFKQDYICQLCGNESRGKIHIHHPSYKIRGYEIFNLDKLTVLCENCHEKFHDIVKD